MRPLLHGLGSGIANASRAAVSALFREYAEHHFYYCALITTGEAHSPCLAAWSRESLSAAAAKDPDAGRDMKWSYADSPFYCYGEQFFSSVREMFDARPPVHFSNPAWAHEYEFRLEAVERAMAKLDEEGVFGTGTARHAIVINVEVVPPDDSNLARALRLNPLEALREWLAEAAELPLR